MRVTRAALEYIGEVARHMQWGTDSPTCMRIVATGEDQFGLQHGSLQPDDVTYEHAGQVVLAVAPDVAAPVEDLTLDLEIHPDGTHRLLMVETGNLGKRASEPET